MKLTKELKVSASMSDAYEGLSVIGCFSAVQDAITELMGELKIDGLTAKRKYNAFWVFVKNKVKFFKKVQWNEKFKVVCFISSKSLAKLNFDVYTTNLKHRLVV